MPIPVVRCATERLERIVSPGITLVIVPGMKAFALYTCSELSGAHVIAGTIAAERKKNAERRK